jgi:uncharacterized oxidoreductase
MAATDGSDIGPHRLVPAEELKAMVRAMCQAKGSSEAEAAYVASNLVEANLTGHDSHGVGMMPTYVESFLKGMLKLNQTVGIVNDLGAVLVLDARNGYGQAIGIQAMDLGMERAKQHGVCLVATRNSHHLGRIGAWAEHCANKGFASMHYVNVLSRPVVAPFGGRDGRFSTNPYCAAVPRANGEHIVLDMATSKVALGKMRVAVRRGKSAPHESVLDQKGEPTDDPNVMYQRPSGAMLPFGEHKGSGLALICELFAGALGGGGTIASIGGGEGTPVNSMLSIVIRPRGHGLAAARPGQSRPGRRRAGAADEGRPAGQGRARRGSDLAGADRVRPQGQHRRGALRAGRQEDGVNVLPPPLRPLAGEGIGLTPAAPPAAPSTPASSARSRASCAHRPAGNAPAAPASAASRRRAGSAHGACRAVLRPCRHACGRPACRAAPAAGRADGRACNGPGSAGHWPGRRAGCRS